MSTPLQINNPIANVISYKQAFGQIAYSWDTRDSIEVFAKLDAYEYCDGTVLVNGYGKVGNVVKSATAGSNYDWGLNYGHIRDILGYDLLFPYIDGHGVIQGSITTYRNGMIEDQITGFGGYLVCFDKGTMVPGRYHNTQGHTGSWSINMFNQGDVIEFTVLFKKSK